MNETMQLVIHLEVEVLDRSKVLAHPVNFGQGTEGDHWQYETPEKWSAQVRAVVSAEINGVLGTQRSDKTGLRLTGGMSVLEGQWHP